MAAFVAVADLRGFARHAQAAAVGHAERGGGLTMVLAYQVVEALRAGRLVVRAFVDLALETCDWEFVEL